MFDIGFSELVMIGLVSLIVIGPERLPKVARLAGFWIGKSRTMMANVKAEIKQELHQEELRQILKDQADLEDFHLRLQEASLEAEAINSSVQESLTTSETDITSNNDSK
jgi:sec-independent protein translocase protein TatB